MIDNTQNNPNCAKIVKTYDSEGNENGYLMELKKDGSKTESYLTVAYPGCFKGYHLHKVRESNYVCIKGEVKVITYNCGGSTTHYLHVGSKLNIPINVPTGIENTSDEEAWLINFPDPAYDPDLKDEQVDYNQEEVLQWVKAQNEPQ